MVVCAPFGTGKTILIFVLMCAKHTCAHAGLRVLRASANCHNSSHCFVIDGAGDGDVDGGAVAEVCRLWVALIVRGGYCVVVVVVVVV